ncbi:GDSL esterase/lipase [Senna tora]|uniref:GDSL esterase/lipase n=1 Tax=Senna tora TaxID=362788 RepID=A0A834SYW9_9FABA|nr:GDSL esterase/lipase [Senna tora]
MSKLYLFDINYIAAIYGGAKKDALPPYLDPKLSIEELMSGVSFASGGSGFDPLTPSISELLNEGGRKIAVTGLPPIGCLPVVITLYSDERFGKRGCIDKYSSIARDYNQMLQNELNLMQLQLNSSNPSSKVYYIDIYQPLSDMVQDPQKYGFDVVDSGCCGSGYIETSFLCNHISSVCSDPSKYLFWDSVHPTQKGYQNLFSAFRPTFDLINNDD